MSDIVLYDGVVEGEIVEQVPANAAIEAVITSLMGEIGPLSQSKYLATIREYLEYTANRPQITPAVSFASYLGWLRSRGLNGSTVNGKRVIVRRFYEWAARIGFVSSPDYYKVKDVKAVGHHGKRRGRWLTKDELRCMLAKPDTSTQIGRRDKAVLAFLIGTAARRDEITKFKWNQLVRVGKVWIIENALRKHQRLQEAIVVPDSLKRILDAYKPERISDDYIFESYDRHGNRENVGKPMSAQTVYNIVRHYAKLCGFEGIAPHDLRRSAAQGFRESGLQIEQISKALGHASITTTQRYLEDSMDLDAIQAAAEFEMDI